MAGCHLVALSGAAEAGRKNDSDFTILERRIFTVCGKYLSGKHKRIVGNDQENTLHKFNFYLIYLQNVKPIFLVIGHL